MRSTRLLTLVLALVPTAFGCGDDIKFPDQVELPDPALNGVFPAKGFTDRTLRVEISGDGTVFDTAPTVSFGAGITVAGVEVSSSSTLFATITIAGDAALGKHDVTVTGSADPLVLTAAFDVQNPLEVLIDGPQLQGGVGSIAIINHDSENPFLGDVVITAGNGTEIFVNQQTEFTIFGTAFHDTDAVSGAVVVEDTLVETVTSRGGELTITPRAGITLTSPGKGPTFAGSGTLTNSTELFKFTAVSAIYRGSTFEANDAPPAFIWLPNGKWAQARGFAIDDTAPVAPGNMFVVIANLDLSTGTAFNVEVDEFNTLPNVVALAEVEDNDELGFGDAQVINQDATLFTGILDDGGDFDMMEVTLEDGEGIHVTTTRGIGGFADTGITIYDDFFDVLDFNDDIDVSTGLFASDLTVTDLPAGTYFIEIGAPFGAFFDDYEAGISILPPPPPKL